MNIRCKTTDYEYGLTLLFSPLSRIMSYSIRSPRSASSINPSSDYYSTLALLFLESGLLILAAACAELYRVATEVFALHYHVLPVMQLLSYFLENLVHAGVRLRAALIENVQSVRTHITLSFRKRNLLLRIHIALVAPKGQYYMTRRILFDILDPMLRILIQRVASGDVVDDEGGGRISIVDPIYGLKSVVTGSIPELDLDGSGTGDVDHLFHVACGHRHLRRVFVVALHISFEDCGLADTGTAY